MAWNLFEDFWTDPWVGRYYEPSVWRSRVTPSPTPPVNIYGNDQRVLVVTELPGLEIGKLDVKVNGRHLTIKGTRELPTEAGEDKYACTEREGGEFSRKVTLPYDVESDQVTAHYEKGVLTIELPRSEADKPRKIAVKVA
jgi:HSP20 family protein